MRDENTRRTKVDGLDEARWQLAHMLSGLAPERTLPEIASVIVSTIASLLAEWGELVSEKRKVRMFRGDGEQGPETVSYQPPFAVPAPSCCADPPPSLAFVNNARRWVWPLDLNEIRLGVVRRWEERGGSKLGPQGLPRLDDERTLLFLRDVLRAFGWPKEKVSGWLDKLDELRPTLAAHMKRLNACGYTFFVVTCCVWGPEKEKKLTNEEFCSSYRRVYVALKDAQLVSAEPLTDDELRDELAKSVETVDDDGKPVNLPQITNPEIDRAKFEQDVEELRAAMKDGRYSFEPLRRAKFGKGDWIREDTSRIRKHGRLGVSLRSSEDIDSIIAKLQRAKRDIPAN